MRASKDIAPWSEALFFILLAGAGFGGRALSPAEGGATAPGPPAQEKAAPSAFDARGRLVCLAEEMKEGYKAEIAPVHEHVLGFRVAGKVPEGGFRYSTILRTKLSEALFVEKRYQDRDLRLVGRVFPFTAILEVSKFQWYKDGKLYDVYYWCEVCAIKGFDPSLCSCCQAKVEFREAPAEEEKNK